MSVQHAAEKTTEGVLVRPSLLELLDSLFVAEAVAELLRFLMVASHSLERLVWRGSEGEWGMGLLGEVWTTEFRCSRLGRFGGVDR